MPSLPSPLQVTACGLVSSLGLDAVTACAAARAGISRAGPSTFPLRSLEPGETELATVHAAPFITEGFEGTARLLRLLEAGWKDLARSFAARPPRATGLYLALPDPRRHERWIESFAPEETVEDLREGVLSHEEAPGLVAAALERARFPVKVELRHLALSCRTAFVEALLRAAEDLASGRVQTAVVGGVDSLLDDFTLNALLQTGRLKTSADPTGLQPGEAAAFLALEATPDDSRPPMAVVIDKVASTENEEPSRGEGLARAILDLHESDASHATEPIWIVSDHNGEARAAEEWGQALCRAAPLFADRQLIEWYPAASFGEIGTASVAAGACLVTRAFERGYAPASRAAVVCSAVTRERGGIAMTYVERRR